MTLWIRFRMKDQVTTIYPADVVLFEGILVFYFPKIRDLFHMKLFVDTDSDTRLARRGNSAYNFRVSLVVILIITTYCNIVNVLSAKRYKGTWKRFGLCPKSIYELCKTSIWGVLFADKKVCGCYNTQRSG